MKTPISQRTKKTNEKAFDAYFKANERTETYVCIPCGSPYINDYQKLRLQAVTMHKGKCDLCGNVTGITHIRAFNWLRDAPENRLTPPNI